jgi:hypothetical protein
MTTFKIVVFLGQMSIANYGNDVDLVEHMKISGDLKNAQMMFNRVKCVEGWTTMACHILNSA